MAFGPIARPSCARASPTPPRSARSLCLEAPSLAARVVRASFPGPNGEPDFLGAMERVSGFSGGVGLQGPRLVAFASPHLAASLSPRGRVPFRQLEDASDLFCDDVAADDLECGLPMGSPIGAGHSGMVSRSCWSLLGGGLAPSVGGLAPRADGVYSVHTPWKPLPDLFGDLPGRGVALGRLAQRPGP